MKIPPPPFLYETRRGPPRRDPLCRVLKSDRNQVAF